MKSWNQVNTATVPMNGQGEEAGAAVTGSASMLMLEFWWVSAMRGLYQGITSCGGDPRSQILLTTES